jgi:hypothetical protein
MEEPVGPPPPYNAAHEHGRPVPPSGAAPRVLPQQQRTYVIVSDSDDEPQQLPKQHRKRERYQEAQHKPVKREKPVKQVKLVAN